MSFSDIPLRTNGERILRSWFNDLRTAGVAATSGVLTTTSFTVANNQSSAAVVTGLSYNGAAYTSAKVDIELRRTTATPTDKMARIELFLYYQGSTWVLVQNDHGDDCGVVFSITTSAGTGQVKYTSTNLSGGSYTGTMKFASTVFPA